MRKTTLVMAIFLLSLISLMTVHAELPPAGFAGCVIATDQGALRDVDCDRVPDPFDNCPLTMNPDQMDRDKNGLGDACDLIIDQIVVEPQQPMQGRSLVITVSLFNNRAYPMRNLNLRAEMPTLKVATNEQIGVLNPGERVTQELVMRIPECAPTNYADLVIIAEYPYAPGDQEVFSQALKLQVVPSGVCSKDPGNDQTVVNILDIQDVDPQRGALYPFTIHNNQQESKAYVLSVQGIEWGAAEINPGTVIVIPPGESREGAIQVWARPDVEGRKSFIFSIQARDDAKQIMVQANVLPSGMQPLPPQTQLLSGIIIFLVLLAILVGLYFLVKKK